MKVTTNKITRHRELIKKNFSNLVAKLQERAYLHDLTKFEDEEFDGFVEADEMQLYKKYGSSNYHKKLKENKGIALHLSKNSHHPEYHKKYVCVICCKEFKEQPNYCPDCKNGYTVEEIDQDNMGFLDIVEMVIDWKSASETYRNDFQESIKYSIDRFKFDEKHEWLIKMIAEVI